FWFVVLMDQLDDRLRQLISFVNTNSRFKVLGVQLDFYRHNEFEIVIPNLYGVETAKEADRAIGTQRSKEWNEDAYFSAVEKKIGVELAQQLRAFYSALQTDPRFTVSGTQSSFKVAMPSKFPKSIFHVYDYGNLLVDFGDLTKVGAD